MTTLWLHIGPPKTGTSALQTLFGRNAEALRRQGLHYPWGVHAAEGRVTSGNGAWLARSPDGFPHEHPKGEVLIRLLERRRNVLLSSEFFAVAERGVLESLKAFTDDIRILAYVREQADTVVSALASGKARNPLRRDQTLEDAAADYWAAGAARLADMLDRFAGIYGRENLRVRSFKQARHQLGRDAVEALGLDPAGFDFTDARINEAPAEKESNPRVVAALREISREQNERVVREWFPGQTVGDVFDFPEL